MAVGNPYSAYLTRFEQRIGAVSVGAYGTWKGTLVRKLAPAEFLAKHDELADLSAHYQKILARGDTLNDAFIKLLRERQSELILDETEAPGLPPGR
jgi:hypothetical protein